MNYILLCVALFFCFQALHAEEPVDKDKEPTLSYSEEDQFSLKSGIEELYFGGYVIFDGRLFVGADQNKSTFLIRTARLVMSGNLYQLFDFMLMARWDKLREPNLDQVWIQTARPKWAQLRFGLFKEPFSLEAQYSSLYLTFTERSLAIRNYHQLEDVGVMCFGYILDEHLRYYLGVFNGRERHFDNNNSKEVVGRLVFTVFSDSVRGHLDLGLSGATGRYDEDLEDLSFRTGADTIFWKWAEGTEVHANRLRGGCDMEWLKGPFALRAEAIYVDWGQIHLESASSHFYGYGGYGQVSYLITGESQRYNAPIIPHHNFDGCKHWGAWEVAARYELFFAAENMLEEGFARGANSVHGPTLGINWYFNPLVASKLDGQYLWFNREISFDDYHMHHEMVMTFRIQAVF